MAITKRHLERVIKRQVKHGKLTQAQADVVLSAKGMTEFNKRVNGLATSQGFKAIGDGKILQWLLDNWQTILQIIMAIIAALGG